MLATTTSRRPFQIENLKNRMKYEGDWLQRMKFLNIFEQQKRKRRTRNWIWVCVFVCWIRVGVVADAILVSLHTFLLVGSFEIIFSALFRSTFS